MNNSNSTDIPGDVSFDNLYPAIVQCFAVILAGYVAGRAGIITSVQGKGIGSFVAKFCLPALLFKSMCELNFSQVNWYFLCGIAVSKTVVFLIVVTLTLLVKRPINLGYAGLFGIFATQSNDFALGYPILQALYGSTKPEYLQYIYLVAPISLVLLNPIGFAMLEIHKRKTNGDQGGKRWLVVIHVCKDVITNPIVFMTLIGVAGNFVFQRNVPYVITNILDVLAKAYSASALFYLGLSLVGKMQGKIGLFLLAPGLLIMAKTLLLPMITWQVVGSLEKYNGIDVNDSRSLSMYGFLYGTFPTAPSVFLYASHFSVAVDEIATGMVACTFLSAPLMFVSARMVSVVVSSEVDYKSMLKDTSFDVSIISLILLVWTFIVLVLSRKYRRMPHHFLFPLVLSQMLACIGMIIYDGLDSKVEWQHYVQFVILLCGVLATRCWTAVISVGLYLLHCRSLCFLLRMKLWLYLFGFSTPILCTGLLLLLGTHHMHNEIDPSFHYGQDQAILSVVVLATCSIVNVTCLVLRQRNYRGHHYQKLMSEDGQSDVEGSIVEKLNSKANAKVTEQRRGSNSNLLDSDGSAAADGGSYSSCSINASDGSGEAMGGKVKRVCSIEDIVPYTEVPKSRSDSASDSGASQDDMIDTIDEHTCLVGTCSPQQRRKCVGILRSYHAINNSSSSLQMGENMEVQMRMPKLKDEYQTGRFIILLVGLQISMFIGLFLCIWRLFNNFASGIHGIYVEIEFLDSVFNYGQALITFAIFGIDTRLIIFPCVKRWRRFLYGAEDVHIPNKSDLEDDVKHLCDQFVTYHKENCARAIQKDLDYLLRTYHNVFTGMEMCDWLIEVGLARDRGEAVDYGKSLLVGQVICHVAKEHHFMDMPYFYRFVDTQEKA